MNRDKVQSERPAPIQILLCGPTKWTGHSHFPTGAFSNSSQNKVPCHEIKPHRATIRSTAFFYQRHPDSCAFVIAIEPLEHLKPFHGSVREFQYIVLKQYELGRQSWAKISPGTFFGHKFDGIGQQVGKHWLAARIA